MTRENDFFAVNSVVIVGASEEKGKIGSGLYKSIATSFEGPIYAVNPKYETLWGKPCYRKVSEIPCVPSHAVIAVARRFVPDTIRECAELGIKKMVVISAGFKETDEIGAQMEREMAAFCKVNGISLLGPNTLGFIDTGIPYNGTFLADVWKPGQVSVISQSGGVGMALLSALDDQCCGIAKWVGIGNEAVMDAVDMLEYLAEDPATSAIGVCFEGLRRLPAFLRLAKEVNKKKPIVILRDGKGNSGMRAAASHTGTMAQSDAVMGDIIAQAGLTEAMSCRECAAMLKALSMSEAPKGNRAVLLTNTAGPSILAADELEAAGVSLPIPTKELQEKTDQAVGLPLGLKNPADISSGGLNPVNYGNAAVTMLGSDEYDILMSFFTLSNHLIVPDLQMMRAKEETGKPVVAAILGKQEYFNAYDKKTEQAGIPCFCDTEDASAAMRALVNWGKAKRWDDKPALGSLSEDQKKQMKDYLANCERGILSEHDAKELLSLAGLPVMVPVKTRTVSEALAAAEDIGYPVVLKVDSRVITHKTDVGGVRLGIRDEAELSGIYDEMLDKMKALDPDAGITVAGMADDGFEMIVGGVRTDAIGPVVMAGMGGIYSEVFKDMKFALAPLCDGEAAHMLEALRCYPILDGFRGEKKDRRKLEEVLELVAEILAAFPEIAEMDLNPVRAYENGVSVLDARIIIK